MTIESTLPWEHFMTLVCYVGERKKCYRLLVHAIYLLQVQSKLLTRNYLLMNLSLVQTNVQMLLVTNRAIEIMIALSVIIMMIMMMMLPQKMLTLNLWKKLKVQHKMLTKMIV